MCFCCEKCGVDYQGVGYLDLFLTGCFVVLFMVLIVNIDSKLPNLALLKIEKFYQGEEVVWNSQLHAPLADKIYVSCLFSENRWKAQQWEMYNAEIGGTGYDVKKVLPLKIDKIQLKINYGFTSRGCIRKCKFCVVHEKEGGIRAVGDIYDLWDGRSTELTLLDNNILALPDHFEKICLQAQKENIRLDFNQGLDIRLVDDRIAKILKKTKLKQKRFALDHPALIPVFKKKLDLMKKYISVNRLFTYVLVGFDTSWEEDMERLLFLKKEGCNPYIMRYGSMGKEYKDLTAWVNQPQCFHKMTFAEFQKTR